MVFTNFQFSFVCFCDFVVKHDFIYFDAFFIFHHSAVFIDSGWNINFDQVHIQSITFTSSTCTTKKRSFSDRISDGFGTEFTDISHRFGTKIHFRTEFGQIGRCPKKPRRKLYFRPKFRPKYISDGFRTVFTQTCLWDIGLTSNGFRTEFNLISYGFQTELNLDSYGFQTELC